MGLSTLPPELKLEIYYHLPHTALLVASHISKFWRSIVLGDARWAQWFEMIVNPETEQSARDVMAAFKILDVIPARTIVTLCFSPKCALCPNDTTFLFLPLLKRICDDCFDAEKHAVMALSVALTTYDLSEKDVKDVVVLHWEETDPERKKSALLERVKFVSAQAVKNIALEKHGGEESLATHLKYKKARVLKAYEKRLAEYTAAHGNGAPPPGKKLPKTRPKLPAILKDAPFYRWQPVLATNFVVCGADGTLEPQRLVECVMCIVMANLRWEDEGRVGELVSPPRMLSGVLAAHEAEAHYERREDECDEGCYERSELGRPPRCDACLNVEAILTKEAVDGH